MRNYLSSPSPPPPFLKNSRPGVADEEEQGYEPDEDIRKGDVGDGVDTGAVNDPEQANNRYDQRQKAR
jgi:hypothetical protein